MKTYNHIYMKDKDKVPSRKTYSISNENARSLAVKTMSLADDLKRNTLPRQDVLDALVEALNDKGVYAKVVKILKKNA